MAAIELDELAMDVLAALPGTAADVARLLGRKPSDGTIRRRLAKLEGAGLVDRVDGEWDRCQTAGNDGPALPPPPDDLEGYEFPESWDADARDQFLVTYVWFVGERGDVSPVDVDLLERYVRALARAREAQEALDEDGVLTRAPSGRAFAHPGVAIVREAERDAHVYMDALRKLAAAGKDGGSGADQEDDLD